MNIHVENIKKLLDGAIKGGLFQNAESVEIISRSVKEVAVMVGEYERLTKQNEPDSKPLTAADGEKWFGKKWFGKKGEKQKTNGQMEVH
jgi:hypothetical protein